MLPVDVSNTNALEDKIARRKKALTHKTKLSDNDTSFDERYWAQFSASQRMEMTWALFVYGCTWLGIDGSKLRLQKSVTSVKRRKS